MTAVADTHRICWIQPLGDTLRVSDFPVRRGGRAVEGSGLENRQGCKPLEGSNPSLSAISERSRTDPRRLVDRLGGLLPLARKSRYLAPSGEVVEWLKALPC